MHCRQCNDFKAITTLLRKDGLWPDIECDVSKASVSRFHSSTGLYHMSKGVDLIGARVEDNLVVIDIYNAKGETVGAQYIDPNGKKRFSKGLQKQGAFAVVSGPIDGDCYVTEGWATGVSVHMATGKPVIVALDAGNLPKVANELRVAYPTANLIVAADNDKPGMEAVRAANLPYVAPETFGADWNDVHNANGLEAVKSALVCEPAVLKENEIDIDGCEDESVWADYYFLSGPNLVYKKSTAAKMKVSAFNIAMLSQDTTVVKNGNSRSVSPIEYLCKYYRQRVLHNAIYAPQYEEIFFEYQGNQCINSYLPNRVPKPDPNWRSKSNWCIFHDHIMNLMPSEREGWLMIQWMAHNVQHPGKKILWTPIVLGIQGDGKTTIINALQQIMGTQNVKSVSNEEVYSSFNAFASGAAVASLEEIRMIGHNRHDVLNKLKPLITNQSISVVRKGQDAIEVPNCTNYCAFTNFPDALPLDDDDRRWAVFKTRYENRQQLMEECKSTYWDEVHTAYKKHFAELRGWLLSVPLDDFPIYEPPDTEVAKSAMIENARSSDELSTRDVIEEMGDVFTMNAFLSKIKQNNVLLNSQKAGKILRKIGCDRTELIRIKNERIRLWFKPNVAKLSEAEIRRIYEDEVNPYGTPF